MRWEAHIKIETGLLKPDLIYWSGQAHTVYVNDIRIASDGVDLETHSLPRRTGTTEERC